jgi:hypothetical protein
MSSVPIATVENPNSVFVFCWEGVKEPDEAVLVIDLRDEWSVAAGSGNPLY